MTEEQFRLACIRLALLRGNSPKGSPEDRAKIMLDWVGDSEIRLECLRLAVEKFGIQARIGAPAIVEEAKKILNFVAPPPPAPPQRMTSVPERKRGRPRKN